MKLKFKIDHDTSHKIYSPSLLFSHKFLWWNFTFGMQSLITNIIFMLERILNVKQQQFLDSMCLSINSISEKNCNTFLQSQPIFYPCRKWLDMVDIYL